MVILAYLFRCFIMLLVMWLALRIIGKKSIAQMTSYELAGIMLLANVAAEPMVFKVVSKAGVGAFFIALVVMLIGNLSLKRKFYNADMSPEVVIVNGKINSAILKKNKMNITLLLSMLRLKGYARLSDIEYAIIEPDGQISVLPKSTARPVLAGDMQLNVPYEGLPLPLILDGEIQYNNLKYANLNIKWLHEQLNQANVDSAARVFLAQLTARNKLYISLYADSEGEEPPVI